LKERNVEKKEKKQEKGQEEQCLQKKNNIRDLKSLIYKIWKIQIIKNLLHKTIFEVQILKENLQISGGLLFLFF